MVLTENIIVGLLNGFMWGFIIALLALGLNLIYGLLEIVNIAHGSLYMIGAVVGWFLIDATGLFVVALVFAPLVVALIGMGMERIVLRPIKDNIPMTVVATFGLVLVFQQIVRLTYGPGTNTVAAPIQEILRFAGISYSGYRIAIAALSLTLLGGTFLFLTRTRYGMWMRGVRQDSEIASTMGIPTPQVYMVTFGLGALFAAIAGVLMAPIVNVNYLMGVEILVMAFVVVIAGGLGSIRGMVIASLAFALLQNLGSIVVDPLNARIGSLLLFIAFILVYPKGIENILKES